MLLVPCPQRPLTHTACWRCLLLLIAFRIAGYRGTPRDTEVPENMAPEPPHPKEEPRGEPVPDFQQALSNLTNPELLSALDLPLLELEKRLFRYAKVGPELLEMADEGLVLAARAKARLGQSLSAAQSTQRDTCRWWGWASGSPRAPVLHGTQNPDLLM